MKLICNLGRRQTASCTGQRTFSWSSAAKAEAKWRGVGPPLEAIPVCAGDARGRASWPCLVATRGHTMAEPSPAVTDLASSGLSRALRWGASRPKGLCSTSKPCTRHPGASRERLKKKNGIKEKKIKRNWILESHGRHPQGNVPVIYWGCTGSTCCRLNTKSSLTILPCTPSEFRLLKTVKDIPSLFSSDVCAPGVTFVKEDKPQGACLHHGAFFLGCLSLPPYSEAENRVKV